MKPNILFITTDQQHPDYIGYANQLVDTPHLDALANRGLIFDRAYSSTPTCTPSRATWITGQYAFTHGAWQIGTSLDTDCISLPGLLSKNGYKTALIGKSHLQSCSKQDKVDTVESAPYAMETDNFRNWTGPWYGFDHVEMCVGHVNEEHAASMHYRAWLEDKGCDLDKHFNANKDLDYGPSVWSIPLEQHQTTWTTDRAINLLDTSLEAASPFYLNVNYGDPHRPFKVPEPYYSQFKDVEIPKPKRRWKEWEDKSNIYQSIIKGDLNELGLQNDSSIRIPAVAEGDRFSKDEANADDYTDFEKERIRVYLGMLKLIDDQVGRLIEHLKETGQYDNTLIVFTSDHGDYLGDHWVWSKGTLHYDGATRVPTFFHAPKLMQASGRTEALFNNVDFAATFLDFAGIETPAETQGTSFTPLLQNDASFQTPEGVLIDYKAEKHLYVVSWITDRYRLTHYFSPLGEDCELYDLKEDPDEFINLAKSPEHQQIVSRLTRQLFSKRLFLSTQNQQNRVSFA